MSFKVAHMHSYRYLGTEQKSTLLEEKIKTMSLENGSTKHCDQQQKLRNENQTKRFAVDIHEYFEMMTAISEICLYHVKGTILARSFIYLFIYLFV